MSFLLTYVHRTAYLMNVLLTYCKSFPRRFITLFLFHKGLKKPVTFLPRNVTFVTPVRARRVLVFDTSAAALRPKKLLAALAVFWGPRLRAAADKLTPKNRPKRNRSNGKLKRRFQTGGTRKTRPYSKARRAKASALNRLRTAFFSRRAGFCYRKAACICLSSRIFLFRIVDNPEKKSYFFPKYANIRLTFSF